MPQTLAGRWRLGFLALALYCAGGVAFALILQFMDLAPPCPLCIFQRIGVIACGALAFLAVFILPRPKGLVMPSLITQAALAGAAVSLRHIQIQSGIGSGEIQDTCGPGLNYMLQVYSAPKVIASVLTGHGDCTEIDWQFMGITLPMIAFAGFVIIAVAAWLIRAWAIKGRQVTSAQRVVLD